MSVINIRFKYESIILCISLIVYLFSEYFPLNILILSSIFLLHVRWQLYSGYLSFLVYFIKEIMNNVFYYNTSYLLNTIITIFCCICIVISIICNFTFPLFKLPKLKGNYNVGTITNDWYDNKRNRRLSAQIWYPTNENTKKSLQSFWYPNSTLIASELCRLFKVPTFILNHLNHCKSNSSLNVPIINNIDDKKFPIIIFCHGFYGFKGDRSFFCEQFASFGYIVLSVDHPGDCAICTFKDGTTIPFYSFLKKGDDEYLIRNEGLKPRVDDIDFIIDKILILNNHHNNISNSTMNDTNNLNDIEKILNNNIDINNIGIFGHSYGSATCAEYLKNGKNNIHINAAIGLDPWIFPLNTNSLNGIKKPLLFLSSEHWDPGNKYKSQRIQIIENSLSKESRGFVIKDTKHHNFDDMPFIVHPYLAKKLNFIGNISPMKCFDITFEYSYLFFKYLNSNNNNDVNTNNINFDTIFPSSTFIFEESRSK